MIDLLLRNMLVSLSNLEIITKWPVTQHFKESVMVGILSNIVQIVMLTTYIANALKLVLLVVKYTKPFLYLHEYTFESYKHAWH